MKVFFRPGEVLPENHLFVVPCVIEILWGVPDTLQYFSHAAEKSLRLKDVLLGKLEINVVR